MPHHPGWNYHETVDAIQFITDTGVQDYAKIGYLLGGRIMENLTITPEKIIVNDGVVVTSINTLKTKRGNYIYRDLPNVIHEEPFYTKPLIDFAQYRDQTITLKEYLGIGGKRSIELKFQKEIGIVPHSLRHLRATHMGKSQIPSSIHKPLAQYLKYYFGWSNIATANYYIDNLTIGEIMSEYREKKGATT